MSYRASTPLRDFLCKEVGALAALTAMLLVGLVMAFGSPSRLSYRLPPSIETGDVVAKALRPQHQLGVQGPSRSIRLRSSPTPEAISATPKAVPHPTARLGSDAAPCAYRLSQYLEQRTRCPRAPPVSVV